MADMRRRIKYFVDISLIIQACMLLYAAARPVGNSEAALSAAEKLVTEALRKEINNELKGIVSSSSNEKLRETSDVDALADILEEGIKGAGNNAEVTRDAVNDGKAMRQSRAGMKKTEVENNKVEEKGKMSFANVPPDQRRHTAKNSGLNDNRLKEQVKEMLLDEMTIPVRKDRDNLDLYQTILRSLKQYSSHDSGSRHHNDEYKEHHNPEFPNKQLYSSDLNKGNMNAKPAARHSKISEDGHQLNDDEIKAKVNEFYNALLDYVDKMQTVSAQERKDRAAQHHALPLDQPLKLQHHALPLDQPLKLQHHALPLDQPLKLQHHALPLDQPLKLQHHALPLDQPFRLSSSLRGKQRQVALSQKGIRDNRKLVDDLEQLADTLKKEEHDSPNDAFPSFAQWFRHQRSLSSLRKGKDATSYRHARLHSDAMADVFRGAEASDLGIDYPWSKYFNRESKSVEQMTKREATDSDEKNFIDEIEKRVAELQRQLDAKREMKEGTALKM